LREALDLVRTGFFARGDRELFQPLVDALLERDPYLVLADFEAYCRCQERVSAAYEDREDWARRAILNCARSGRFSSDRTIREYCNDIWRAGAVPVRLLSRDEVKAGFLQ
jgi:starch phosphorylase